MIVEWKHGEILRKVINLIDAQIREGEYGPYTVSFGRGWAAILCEHYRLGNGRHGKGTLRQRVGQIESITDVTVTLDEVFGAFDIKVKQVKEVR